MLGYMIFGITSDVNIVATVAEVANHEALDMKLFSSARLFVDVVIGCWAYAILDNSSQKASLVEK